MFATDFDDIVIRGESISCEVDGFQCTAIAHYDQDSKPEEDAPAELLASWQRDEWHYFGIAVTVSRAGVQLTGDYDHALWGIAANVLGEKPVNGYLRTVANDLLPEAIAAAKEKIKELCK